MSLQRLPPGGSWRRKATEGECVNVKFYKAPHSRGLLPSLTSSLVTPPSQREAKVRFALNKLTDKSKFETQNIKIAKKPFLFLFVYDIIK